MRKIILFIFLMVVAFNYAANYMVDSDFYKGINRKPFAKLPIKHDKAKEIIEKYFNGQPYKVIISEPWGYKSCDRKKCGYERAMIYFAVEEYMPEKYYFAIKKGIVVTEDGKIDSILDNENGFFIDKGHIIDFNKIGLNKNTVKSFILNQPRDNEVYWINLIDQNDNNINDYKMFPASEWFFAIGIKKVYRRNANVTSLITMNETDKELFNEYKKNVETFFKLKAQGKAVKSAAVKEEFERLKKAGLVQEN